MNEYLSAWFDGNESDVRAFVHRIWSHPEVALGEHYACRETVAFL